MTQLFNLFFMYCPSHWDWTVVTQLFGVSVLKNASHATKYLDLDNLDYLTIYKVAPITIAGYSFEVGALIPEVGWSRMFHTFRNRCNYCSSTILQYSSLASPILRHLNFILHYLHNLL